MTYDFHGDWEDYLGYNAPLYSSKPSDEATVSHAVEYWLNEGAKAEKINLGLAAYGRSFLFDTKPVVNEKSVETGEAGRVRNLLKKNKLKTF